MVVFDIITADFKLIFYLGTVFRHVLFRFGCRALRLKKGISTDPSPGVLTVAA